MAEAESKGLSLTHKVLIGGLLGIAAGITFGDRTSVLEPVGRIYVLLVQVVVYPYIIASLLHGISRLKPMTARRFFRAGLPIYLGLWFVTFAVLFIAVVAFPSAAQLVFYPDTEDVSSVDAILALLIPSDPFQALSENHMAAVVVFCILFGIALQHVDEKAELLKILETIRDGSAQFWHWTARLVPYAIFALFAVSAGTMSMQSLPQLALYFSLLLLGCLVLALWIIPAALSAIAPISFRETMAGLKPAIAIAVATSVPAAAIPFVVEMTRKMLDRTQVKDEQRDDIVATNISIAYVIGSTGTLFVYLYIKFAGSYFGEDFSFTDEIVLPMLVLLSSAGSATAIVSFVGDWLKLPPAALQLYAETSTIGRYPRSVLEIVAMGFLSVAIVLNYYGKLKVRLFKLGTTVAIPFVFFAAGVWGLSVVDRTYVDQGLPSFHEFTLSPDVTRNINVSVESANDSPSNEAETAGTDPAFVRVQRSGVLRVGVTDNTTPFTYRNDEDDIVGFDIAFAYELANALDVGLVLVPLSYDTWQEDLLAGRFDIAMSGLYLTEKRLRDLAPSTPYLTSGAALFGLRETVATLLTRKAVEENDDLTFYAFNEEALLAGLNQQLPNTQISPVTAYDDPPKLTETDVALWSVVPARALAQSHDGFAASVPDHIGDDFIFVYYMSPDSPRMQIVVNNLLQLLIDTGWYDWQAARWFDGIPPPSHQRRWSIIDNVLRWGAKNEDTVDDKETVTDTADHDNAVIDHDDDP